MSIKHFISSFHPLRFFIAFYVILALGASSHTYILKTKNLPGHQSQISTYNNYLIFKYSHLHLLDGKNLFLEYSDEHWDIFKYSPTFALFFGCFAWFPDWLGLTLWNMMNMMFFSLSIRFLPNLDNKKKLLILLFSVADAMTSLQNSQSNLLVAGLVIMGFDLLEKENNFLATLCLVGTFYIKIFGIAALIMLIFYPGKWKSVLYTIFWMIVLWIIPVIITGFKPLISIYIQYYDLLQHDLSVSLGMSVMGWIQSWFGVHISKTIPALTGFIIMCLPLVKFRKFANYSTRILFFCSMMIWMVIFNHKAESPTFIIATAAIYIWFFIRERTKVNTFLICIVIIFTSLSSTDLFPATVRDNFFVPYVIKVVPCILVWIKIVADMFQAGECEVNPGNSE